MFGGAKFVEISGPKYIWVIHVNNSFFSSGIFSGCESTQPSQVCNNSQEKSIKIYSICSVTCDKCIGLEVGVILLL